MISRKSFILSFFSCLATYILENTLRITRVWGRENKLASLVEQANSQILNGNYTNAIDIYKKAIAREKLSFEQEVGITNNLVRALRLESEELRHKSNITKEYNEERAKEYKNDAKQLKQEAVVYAQKAYSSLQAKPKTAEFSRTILFAQAWLNLEQLQQVPTLNHEAIFKTLQRIPSSPSKSYLMMQVALSAPQKRAELIKEALSEAEKINYIAGKSLALGHLAKIYQTQGKYQEAITLNEQAIAQAQRSLSITLLYQWLWQGAQIYRIKGKIERAKNYYERAIYHINSLRENQQISIYENRKIWSLYQEFLGLLLESPQSSNLKKALEIADGLQVLRLENYFSEKCLKVVPSAVSIQEILAQTNSALIRIIVFEEKTCILYLLSNGEIHSSTIKQNKPRLKNLIKNWHKQLLYTSIISYEPTAKQLYEWIISPLEKHLKGASIKPSQLIFIGEDFFNNIPLTALINPQKPRFLIQDYTIINCLTTNLRVVQSSQLSTQNFLGFGLTSERLPFIQKELNAISQETNQAKIFLDRDFNIDNLETQIVRLKEKTILHLASHGEFNGLAETSFLEAYKNPIFVFKLKQILEKNSHSISLLILSACETAIGSSDSILGMAGTAFLAGVSQNLGTLWEVEDRDIAEIMKDFYSHLKQSNKVAEALRIAQLNQIAKLNQHPYQWAAPILLTTNIDANQKEVTNSKHAI